MILDRLLEKKDISAYIDFRIKQLVRELNPEKIKLVKEKKRQEAVMSIKGRIKELQHFKGVVHGDLKRQSIITATDVLRKERLEKELKE